jgi:hypothetical protein
MIHASVDGIFPKKKDMVGCVEIPATTISNPITEVTSAIPLKIGIGGICFEVGLPVYKIYDRRDCEEMGGHKSSLSFIHAIFVAFLSSLLPY